TTTIASTHSESSSRRSGSASSGSSPRRANAFRRWPPSRSPRPAATRTAQADIYAAALAFFLAAGVAALFFAGAFFAAEAAVFLAGADFDDVRVDFATVVARGFELDFAAGFAAAARATGFFAGAALPARPLGAGRSGAARARARL